MIRGWLPALCAGALGVTLWGGLASPAQAQYLQQTPTGPQYPQGPALVNFFYYPYTYFPHNYWPNMAPKWPEPPGMPYQRPPAYMAFPPFKEPHWRYEYWEPQFYYRGNHFLLDIF